MVNQTDLVPGTQFHLTVGGQQFPVTLEGVTKDNERIVVEFLVKRMTIRVPLFDLAIEGNEGRVIQIEKIQ